MIGDVLPSEMRTFTDPNTGAAVTQLTSLGATNRTLYFTNRPFTHEGQRMVVLSDRNGRRQMFSLDLRSGKLVQLTDDEVNGNVSCCVDAQKNFLYYHTGTPAILRRVNLDSLQTEDLLRCPDGFALGIISCNVPGRICFEMTQRIPQGLTRLRGIASEKIPTLTPSTPSGAESYYFRPKTLIYVYDVDADKLECVWGDHRSLSHPQISPTHPALLIYSDFDGYDGADRCYAIDLDKPRKRKPIAALSETPTSRACHEFFTRRGNLAAQWMQGDLQVGGRKQLCHIFRHCAGRSVDELTAAPLKIYALPEQRDFLWHHFTMSHDETWGLHDRWLTAPNDELSAQFLSVFRHQDTQPQTLVDKLCHLGPAKNDVLGLGPECHLDDRDELAYFTGFHAGAQVYRVDVRPAVDRLMQRQAN